MLMGQNVNNDVIKDSPILFVLTVPFILECVVVRSTGICTGVMPKLSKDSYGFKSKHPL